MYKRQDIYNPLFLTLYCKTYQGDEAELPVLYERILKNANNKVHMNLKKAIESAGYDETENLFFPVIEACLLYTSCYGVFYRRVRESQKMIVDRYYYHQLNKQEQAIYKAFYKGVMSHQEIIPIPVRGEFSQESFERIFMAMTRDNPLIYFLNQSACSTASDMFGRLAKMCIRDRT